LHDFCIAATRHASESTKAAGDARMNARWNVPASRQKLHEGLASAHPSAVVPAQHVQHRIGFGGFEMGHEGSVKARHGLD